jgi:hypothetical protein
MTLDELKEVIEGFKKEGYTEEEILQIFYLMYVDNKIPLDDLRIFTEVMGWKFSDEFENMSEEDKKKKGLKYNEDNASKFDKEEIEDAKEYGDEDDKDKEKKAVTAADTDDKKDEEEDDDDKKAARLFGFDKDKK